MKYNKPLIGSKMGYTVNIDWLKHFATLSSKEQKVLLLLIQKQARNVRTSMTNADIALELESQPNKISVITKYLSEIDFLKLTELKQPKKKPLKKYYVPTDVLRFIPKPAQSRIISQYQGNAKTQLQAIEPTIDETTWKRQDLDTKYTSKYVKITSKQPHKEQDLKLNEQDIEQFQHITSLI